MRESAISAVKNENNVGGSSSDELLDAAAVCKLFGGSQPIHQSTLYRGIKVGRFPKPLKIGPKTNRWKACECAEVVARRSAERDCAPATQP